MKNNNNPFLSKAQAKSPHLQGDNSQNQVNQKNMNNPIQKDELAKHLQVNQNHANFQHDKIKKQTLSIPNRRGGYNFISRIFVRNSNLFNIYFFISYSSNHFYCSCFNKRQL